jgi:hypothetical protein
MGCRMVPPAGHAPTTEPGAGAIRRPEGGGERMGGHRWVAIGCGVVVCSVVPEACRKHYPSRLTRTRHSLPFEAQARSKSGNSAARAAPTWEER